MRTVKVNLYSVKELTGKAKDRAIEAGRQWHNETFDADNMTEQLQDHAKEKFGVVTDECMWSISFCQGDGVAFYGNLDLDVLSAKHRNVAAILRKAKKHDITLSVKIEGRNGRYHHYNTMDVEVENDYGFRYNGKKYREARLTELERISDGLAEELRAAVKSILVDASHDTYSWGEDCILADSEDDAIEDLLDANDWEFDVNGRVFNHPEQE
jgi:uncharacterized protein YjbJ (UPF0337 family)